MRNPAVAGAFYPAGKEELQCIINGFLQNVSTQPLNGTLVALICPHAGYVYSGQVAAYAYKQLEGKHFDTVVLLGPSHRVPVEGAYVFPGGQWKTPLGTVKVDSAATGKIARENSVFVSNEEPFIHEHSLEVQLPFLQTILRNFEIIPVLVNISSQGLCRSLSDAIVKAVKGKETLIVSSTDMSHYHSYAQACLMDKLIIEDIRTNDTASLIGHLQSGDGELCGGAGVLTALFVCKAIGGDTITLLNYANSGDVTGDKQRVVGYSSFAITATGPSKTRPLVKTEEGGGRMLNEQQRDALIKIARETIENYIKRGKVPSFNVTDPALKEKRGVFVTLHEYGNLRGCIGYIMPLEELYLAVSRMAIESATADPRFKPVVSSELGDIDIEISVLTVPEKVGNINKIEMGKHGVIVKKGFRQGVFLPQVATETRWSREEFLSRLCADKAGLPEDAWKKDREVELLIFSAQVFREKK